MKNLKIFTLSLIFLIANYFAALADLTASAPSNMISSIASSSSFTSLDQNGAQAQNVTDNLLDSEQLQETVETGAETFGAQQNDDTITVAAEEEQFVSLTSNSNITELEFPEPNLDTIVYDTGLMTLTANTSAQYNSGLGDSGGIFSGEQKARIKVYIDFVRQKQWGSIESHITLKDTRCSEALCPSPDNPREASNDLKTMKNIFEGGAQTVLKLPVEGQLIGPIISSETAKPLNIDFSINPTFANEESPFEYDRHSINSILQDNTTPTLAEFLEPATDLADMQKAISHGSNNDGVGDKGVLVQAKFKTAAGGKLGTSTASFEVSTAGKCSASGCTVDQTEIIKTSIIRLEATATTKATKFTGE